VSILHKAYFWCAQWSRKHRRVDVVIRWIHRPPQKGIPEAISRDGMRIVFLIAIFMVADVKYSPPKGTSLVCTCGYDGKHSLKYPRSCKCLMREIAVQAYRHGNSNENEGNRQNKDKLPDTDSGVIVNKQSVEPHNNWGSE